MCVSGDGWMGCGWRGKVADIYKMNCRAYTQEIAQIFTLREAGDPLVPHLTSLILSQQTDVPAGNLMIAFKGVIEKELLAEKTQSATLGVPKVSLDKEKF